jgi:hypothetical protein
MPTIVMRLYYKRAERGVLWVMGRAFTNPPADDKAAGFAQERSFDDGATDYMASPAV